MKEALQESKVPRSNTRSVQCDLCILFWKLQLSHSLSAWVITIVKVELMEVHTLYKVAEGCRIEGRDAGVAHLAIGVKVARVDGLE